MITSRDNPKLKLVRKLATRRQRDKLGQFVAEGEDLVASALEGGWELDFALVDAARPTELPVRVEQVSSHLLEEISTLGHAPRVIGVFRAARPKRKPPPLGLELWRVGDPGNVGTLARACDAFGAYLALSPGCADPFGPKALRAAMGSTFRVPLPEFELRNAVALVPAGGEPLDELDARRYATFVLGSEREGLPEDIVARCDAQATIPVQSVDSLNVAMAGTVALYAHSRRKADT
jgi:TrmH family RNA methyltransferase